MIDKNKFRKMINDNPGDTKTFRCVCGSVHKTNDKVPPVILCPDCGEPVKLEVVNRG